MKSIDKANSTPFVPKMGINEMVALSEENPEKFGELAANAGHSDPEIFLNILLGAKVDTPDTHYEIGSTKKFLVKPDPAKDSYYIDIEKQIIKLVNATVGQKLTGIARKRNLSKITDMYKQIYDRERHVRVYEMVSDRGVSLSDAISIVEKDFSERIDKVLSGTDLPEDLREAEANGMRGVGAKSYYEIDMETSILGPSEVFGELGIQNKRDGLGGGRIYWPRGKPDGSLD